VGHWGGRIVVIGLVTRHTGRIRDRVIVVDVAIHARAGRHLVIAGQREACSVVIEGRIQPGCRAVTDVAGLGQIRRHVIGIGRALVVLQVARDAGRAVQAVVIVLVTVRTEPRRHRVQPGQSEARARMVKLAIGPQVGVVTLFAGGRECRRRVGYRSRRIVVISLVARDAGRVRNRVIVVDVAIHARAGRHHMIAGQRETCGVVIESRIQPGRRGMTVLAGLR